MIVLKLFGLLIKVGQGIDLSLGFGRIVLPNSFQNFKFILSESTFVFVEDDNIEGLGLNFIDQNLDLVIENDLT